MMDVWEAQSLVVNVVKTVEPALSTTHSVMTSAGTKIP